LPDGSKLRTIGLNQTQQYVGVYQVRVAGHQSCSP
jgi:hypothetical protein